MFKYIIGSIALLVVILFALQIDDKLNPAAENLIAKVKMEDYTNDQREAYFYLMGIGAHQDEDPITIGKSIYNLFNSNEEGNEYYKKQNALELPQGDLFCSSWENACIVSLFTPSEKIDNILKKNKILLDRYQHFLSYNSYLTITDPSISEPLPYYNYITKGNRLIILQSIQSAQKLEYKQALEILSKNISLLRKQLSFQDTLIGKLVFLLQLSENIDVAFLVSKKANKDNLFKVPPLTEDERSFELPIARELSMSYNMFKELDGNPEFWQTNGSAPSWIVKLFFKPNITINSLYPEYQAVIDYALLSHQDFVKRLNESNTQKITKSWIRNPTGTILANVASVNYHEYSARFYDLDTKILLFNALIGKESITTRISNIKNPYYSNSKTAFIDNNKVCFDGPLPDELKLRCLIIEM
jgi:hypothetical protein